MKFYSYKENRQIENNKIYCEPLNVPNQIIYEMPEIDNVIAINCLECPSMVQYVIVNDGNGECENGAQIQPKMRDLRCREINGEVYYGARHTHHAKPYQFWHVSLDTAIYSQGWIQQVLCSEP